MADTANGKPRVRIWPRKKGRAKTKKEQANRDKFRDAQDACRYVSPQQKIDWAAAVKDTPLLPRDLLTAMMYGRLCSFVMPDGQELYPMAARQDVSASLDAIARTPGATLQRGPEYWGPAPLPGPASLSPVVILDHTITAATPFVAAYNIGLYNSITVIGFDIGGGGSTLRVGHVSTNNGGSWYTGASDYRRVVDGVASAAGVLRLHAGDANSSNRVAYLNMIREPNNIMPAIFHAPEAGQDMRWLAANSDRIDAIRVANNNGANLTSGRIIVLGY